MANKILLISLIGMLFISCRQSEETRIKNQSEFIDKSFEIISENSSTIDFFTWYRLYDKPDESCMLKIQEDADSSIPTLGLGASSEFVVERLGHYLCESGLITENNQSKSGWEEFTNQIKMIQ